MDLNVNRLAKFSSENSPQTDDYDDEMKIQERLSGIRRASLRGYDIINNNFFVIENIIDLSDEHVIRNETINFNTFDEYYKFLDGKIYDNACYYMFDFEKSIIDKYNIKMDKINCLCLIDYTIDDDNVDKTLERLKEEYDLIEHKKKNNKKWLNKILESNTFYKLRSVMNQFAKSKTYNYYFNDIFIYFYIMNNPKRAFKVLMNAINNREYYISPYEMCLFYSTKEVLSAIDYSKSGMSKTSIARRMTELNSFIDSIDSGSYSIVKQTLFDKRTNYYVVKEKYITDDYPVTINRYFATIGELISYLNKDISNCDFSFSTVTQDDVKDCKFDNLTTFSIFYEKIKHVPQKYYKGDHFTVSNIWFDHNGNQVYKFNRDFKYFFDFVYYLKGDLSDSDLVLCDGLINIDKNNNINFNNARITSNIMKKLGFKYEIVKSKHELISFAETIKNEEETQIQLYKNNEINLCPSSDDKCYIRISYVSDIHLLHRIEKCETKFDIEYVIRNVINSILNDCSRYLLIGGDISSNYDIYKIFIEELDKSLKDNYRSIKVFFVLGNHDFWDFNGKSINEIVKKYKELINYHGMYLIHNNLMYLDDGKIKELTFEDIENKSYEDIRKSLRKANLIITGGTGFSGYNEKFNANMGIYRNIIDRHHEIVETKIFEDLYLKLKKCIFDKNVVLFTHMPKTDWSKDEEYMRNWVYVSGHTHRNSFYDDGDVRIYSDNQLGYKYKTAYSKAFYIEYDYDLFSDYSDGIYQITKEDYNSFYRGKNISMSYNRDGIIYMLKKANYYCFIRSSSSGKLSILNGGSLKSLDRKDIKYYYDNMSSQIKLYKEPLDKYTEAQKEISNVIKKIGGRGTIHGSIIDIDFYNHVYLNPFDKTITCYFAYDIIDKYVYKNFPSILKANLPELYENYQKQITNSDKSLALLDKSNELILKPVSYSSTDIYNSSREIKKMQRLNSGILTVWYEVDDFNTKDKFLISHYK